MFVTEKRRPETCLGIPVAFGIMSKQQDVSCDRSQMEGVMAKVIEFYVPNSLPKKANYIARNERGKLIAFPSATGNHPDSGFARWHGISRPYIAPLAGDFASDGGCDTA